MFGMAAQTAVVLLVAQLSENGGKLLVMELTQLLEVLLADEIPDKVPLP